jgi:hypothetical protein
MRDLMNNIHPKRGIDPVVGASDNTAQVSQIIDRQGFESLTWLIATVEHGDAANLSDAAAVADEDLIGTEALAGFTFADDSETRKIGYKGTKRYVRLTITPAANLGAWPVAAIAVLGHPTQAPTLNPPV